MTPFRLARFQGPDDPRLQVTVRDYSGGANSRMHPAHIGENQAVTLDSMDIATPGQRKKRLGSVQIADDIGNDSVLKLYAYNIQGTTDQLLMYEDTSLFKWTGAGSWSSIKADFTTAAEVGIITAKQSGIAPDDVVMVQNGTEQVVIKSDGTVLDISGGGNPPQITTVMAWFQNRIWTLKNDLLEFSNAYPSDYGEAFDNTEFRIPVGEERVLVPTRDLGLVCLGENGIWAIAPSATPAATDKPVPLVTSVGCVSKQGAVLAGDDIYFFAQDGFRALKRTVQDKLQLGASVPISHNQKDKFDLISWANISKLSMVYFDNRIFITVPVSASTFHTWVYYPATDGFTFINTGYNPRSWAVYKVSGEEQLFYGKHGNGVAYRADNGFTDEGTTASNGNTITMTEETRQFDFGQPLVKKVGGEVELEATATSGDVTLTISAKVDNGSYAELGTMDTSGGDAPTLPVALPFALSDDFTIRGKFHLDSLGPFRTIQFKIENADTPAEDIKIVGLNVVTFREEYESE